jgi:ubiquinone/menaquinone biosynthesis C-methylase UbiE
MIDYTKASKTYDNTRNSDDFILDIMNSKGMFEKNKNILDFGCGTGNYLKKISEKYLCNCYGVEPSSGMRDKAKEKNPSLIILEGDHEKIPFENDYFDFIFMTDVIHHVPDLSILFGNLQQKAKISGYICIVTQGWNQIDNRWFNQYFPSLSKNEKSRYPDIDRIIETAVKIGLKFDGLDVKKDPEQNKVTDYFIKLVEEKNFSMFRVLDQDEYLIGLDNLRKDTGKIIEVKDAGESLIWLKK